MAFPVFARAGGRSLWGARNHEDKCGGAHGRLAHPSTKSLSEHPRKMPVAAPDTNQPMKNRLAGVIPIVSPVIDSPVMVHVCYQVYSPNKTGELKSLMIDDRKGLKIQHVCAFASGTP
jgi:hypothetical protein